MMDNSHHCICESAKNTSGTSGSKWSIVIYIEFFIPMDYEVWLLIWFDGAALKGSINIHSGCLCTRGGLSNYFANL
ncbi:hypothetical protein P691DRAFT_854071 [Macrolepiota fuliginosa MF-IS2]|uniref:Uncharacterized protein n=1 Tax=Macrolepiota fuliginosa MF-IS2 TaxID=1400762 RepID=A0A9P5X266_9AGAR|nr:hypothetical protein P691DRAFT_854071 [Macrolepiota fuliginosa MF-IS2]